ncbi:single stranded DNA-binding protein [Enterobacteria phage phiC600P9]|nr:single stranded DNA-binding protein [Enterobacteria phage phiC600P9]
MFKRKSTAELAAQMAKLAGNKGGFSSEDKGEWKLKLDNAGNGQAVIRFLPSKNDEQAPFAILVNHGFKKNGKWYIENCSSTHGDYDSCPVCQYISKNDLYNTDNKEYSLVKRKTSYWANILVVKDPAAPENEGKVFKYRFGKKIWDKINAMIAVDVEMGETPVDVTCPWEGANFVLKVKQVSGFSNYDESKFLNQSAIPNIDDESFQKELFEQMVDLSEMTSKDKFKSFEELSTKFSQVMGTAAMGGAAATAAKKADKVADDLDAFNVDDFKTKTEDDFMSSSSGSSSSADDTDLKAYCGTIQLSAILLMMIKEENNMAKIDIDVVDFEYIEEIIRNRYPELRITSALNDPNCNVSVVIEGPLNRLKQFMVNEYCDGMDAEDVEFYTGFIEQ